MLTIRFSPSDLASVRFTVSPLIELWQSVCALQAPVAPSPPSSWLADARARVSDLDFETLCALAPGCRPPPGFVHPPSDGPSGKLERELARMLAAPPDQVRREISLTYPETGVPAVLRRFVETPATAVRELAELLLAYWQRVLASHWPRIRAALESDVLHRAQQAASGGIQALLGDIDSSVRYDDARLIIDKCSNASLELRGRGLLLVPSVFSWLPVAIIDEGPRQPMLIYPARGSGLVWEPLRPPPQTLAALIGPRRASVLALLETPCSTTGLARRLEVGAGSVSQHLAVLHDAGLIERHRVGRLVLYRRSSAGNLLLTRNGHHASQRSRGQTSGKRSRVAVMS